MGQWSELPRELLVSIEELLELYVHKVRVRAVCMSWNSLLPKMPNHQVKQLPWLLQAFEKNRRKTSHGFFDLSEEKFYEFNLPELHGKFFIGSSHGWVLTIQDIPVLPTRYIINTADMYIINPLTGVQIRLPPRYTFPNVEEFVADRDNEYCIRWDDRIRPDDDGTFYTNSEHINMHLTHKIVLSTTPSSEDCVVVAIYGEFKKLAWCKCNDEKWTPLNLCYPRNCLPFEDVIFYKGKLHALNCHGEILVFDNMCLNSKMTILVPETPNLRCYEPMYLVEGSDERLMCVMRNVGYIGADGDMREDLTGDERLHTSHFQVFKLDSINSSLRWVEVKNIDDDMFFLGSNSSFSISSRDFPGYKGNRIFFTDSFVTTVERDCPTTVTDIGVFNVEDGSVEVLPGFEFDVKLLWPPPVWIMRPSSF